MSTAELLGPIIFFGIIGVVVAIWFAAICAAVSCAQEESE